MNQFQRPLSLKGLVTWILLEEGYGVACLAYTLRTLRSAVINEVDP